MSDDLLQDGLLKKDQVRARNAEDIAYWEMEVVKTAIPMDESTDKLEFRVDKGAYYAGLLTSKYCRFRLVREMDDDRLTGQALRDHGLRNTLSVDILHEDVVAFIKRPDGIQYCTFDLSLCFTPTIIFRSKRLARICGAFLFTGRLVFAARLVYKSRLYKKTSAERFSLVQVSWIWSVIARSRKT